MYVVGCQFIAKADSLYVNYAPATGGLFQSAFDPLSTICMLLFCIGTIAAPWFSTSQVDCDWLKKYKQARAFLALT